MTNDEIRKKFEDRYEKSLFPIYKFNRTLAGVYADDVVQFLWEGFYSGFTVVNEEIERIKSELAEKDAVLKLISTASFGDVIVKNEYIQSEYLAKEVLQKYRKSEG